MTVVGGYAYGYLHNEVAEREPEIALIDRPYVILELMLVSPPAEYEGTPSEWYLIIFWYVLPFIFVFIIGNGVVDFVRLFFARDSWRRIMISTYQKHIIVLGAGHVGLRVVKWLKERLKLNVVVIDNDPDPEALDVLEQLGVLIIRADARVPSTMTEANIEHASAFLACTGDDPVNLYAVMRARDMNRNIRIVMRVWDDQFANQIDDLIINTQDDKRGILKGVLSSSDIAAPVFAGMALGVEVTQSMTIGGVEYSTMRMIANKGSFLDGAMVGDIQARYDLDIVLLSQRGQKPEVEPDERRVIQAGDTLVMFAEHECLLDLAARNEFLDQH